MRVLRGREQEHMAGAAFEELAGGYGRVVVDVGTGDGLLPYRLASADPTSLYVGCDPVAENMVAVAVRSRRKPSKGGVANLLLVVATAEDPPTELRERAAEVFCVLPWGRLLEGLVTADVEVLAGLRSLARPAAPLHLVLNTGVWGASTPRDVEDLPEVTGERVERVLAPAYAEAGLTILEHRPAGPAEVRQLKSTWAGRLTHGGGGRFMRIEAVAA